MEVEVEGQRFYHFYWRGLYFHYPVEVFCWCLMLLSSTGDHFCKSNSFVTYRLGNLEPFEVHSFRSYTPSGLCDSRHLVNMIFGTFLFSWRIRCRLQNYVLKQERPLKVVI
ncbi:hypothetical protein CDAR_262801 [Caerostris darwini]|uniref:Uncharacterized protein n=1 Tax=Caerostris darwini TaxID=1538125 RepID=A0AAV4RYK3_9ARAC|nr:hypothetical protein CDAR_262801 [Caerostris darwini]